MKYFKIISSLLFLVMLASCKKELNQEPHDSIIESKAFLSVFDLQQGLEGVYAQNSNINRIYIAALLSDELKLSNENRGQGQSTFKFQFSASDAEHTAGFQQYYQMLDVLHRILAGTNTVIPKNAEETQKIEKIRAELYAFRGIAYYELLIRFMPSGYDPNALAVPLILASDVFATPGRSKVSEVVARIEADFATARASTNIPSDATDDLHINQAAIATYQARLALLKKDWSAALNYANEAMMLVGTSRTLLPRASYKAYWTDANEIETVWQFKNQASPRLLWRDTNGDVFFEPSDKLKALFPSRTADIRFSTFFGSATPDTSIIVKYPGSSLGTQINTLKLIRVSELYLMRAEAYAELNQLTDAGLALDSIRMNRITGYTSQTYSTQADAIDAVMNERFKELCFEGFRFFDLKRRTLAVDRLASDVGSSLWQTLPAGNFRFAMPIPSSEILANPNETQNPGY